MLKKSKQKWFLSKLRALADSGTLEVGLKGDCEKISLNFVMPFPFSFPVIPGNNNVSFPFPKFGNGISIPVPVPKNWEWNFHSRSRSQKLGMQFIIPVPVPKVWEWAEPFPFPFPNVQKSFPLTPDSSDNWGHFLSLEDLQIQCGWSTDKLGNLGRKLKLFCSYTLWRNWICLNNGPVTEKYFG